MESIHIMSRDDTNLYPFQQKNSYPELSEIYTICFKGMFRDVVNSTLFTVTNIEYIGEIKIKEDVIIHNIDEEEVDLIYNLMKGDIHRPIIGSKIVDMLVNLWEKNEYFQELSHEYYLVEDKEELAKHLKIFHNFNNPVEIDSVWNFYRFKLIEMYVPIKSKILSLYGDRVFETSNPFHYNINGKKNIKSVVFHDKKYQPEIVVL